MDQYRVMRLVGRGGMGEVYLARDNVLGRKVALKLLSHARLSTAAAREQFLLEAQATAAVSHAHIVTIYGCGEFQGTPYLTLEYLEGQTLRERMVQDPPSVASAARIGLALAEALRAAHEKGVLHGDLKPENVLCPRDGRLRVVDFGVARLADALPGEGPAEGVTWAGTPAYMAPEQWRGETLTPATDVWALGVILYEVVYGRHPFHGLSYYELIDAVSSAAPVARPAPEQGVPAALADVIDGCLAKNAADRPPAAHIVAALESVLSPRVSAPLDEECPFPGLMPFSEQHAELFFGRDAEIAEFLERLRHEPVTPIVGPSGAGKTSFVQAGVIPRLREQGGWEILSLRPGARPFRALAQRLVSGDRAMPTVKPAEENVEPRPRPLLPEEPQANVVDLLAGVLLAAPQSLAALLRSRAEESRARVLLHIDQLEETHTLVADEAVRRAFIEAIAGAADDPQDPVRVCLTLRDDFLGRIAVTPRARAVLQQVTVLRAPEPEALAEILVRPLAVVGYRWEDPSLPRDIVAEVGAEPASLPLIQFAARMLWDRRDRSRRLLTQTAYTHIGRVGGALAGHAEAVLAGLSPEELRTARAILLRLVTAHGTRRVLPLERALEGLGSGADEVVRRLTQARLVTVRRARDDEGADAELELAHESLIQRWGTLARWIDESREELAFLAEVGQAAELWERRGKSSTEVWRGEALREARRMVGRLSVAVPARTAAFLAAGERAERQRTRRRRWLAAGAFAFLAVAAMSSVAITVMIAGKERISRRRAAEAERESARAAYMRGEPLEARAKVRAALEIEDSVAARALWRALSRDELVWKRDLGVQVRAVAFAPDGGTVMAACQNGTVHLLEQDTLAVRVLRQRDQLTALAVSPDSRRLATGAWSGQLNVWELGAAEPRRLEGHTGVAWGVAFSPDGRWLASAGADGAVRVWDLAPAAAAGGRLLAVPGAALTAVAFSPDGSLVAVGSYDRGVRVLHTDGRLARAFAGHDDRVTDVAWFPDGHLLASASLDGTVRVHDVDQGVVAVVVHGDGSGLDAVAVSPDASRLALGGRSGAIVIADAATGARTRTLLGHQDAVTDLAFGRDSRRLVSGSLDKTLRLWDVTRPGAAPAARGHTANVIAVAFTRDGTRLASASYDRTVRLWDVASGAELRTFYGHTERIFTLDALPDGWMASGGEDRTIRLFSPRPGDKPRALAGDGSRVFDLVAARDGSSLLIGSAGGRALLIDATSGAVRATLGGGETPIVGVALSADGRLAATGGDDGSVRVWDLPTGRIRGVLTGHQKSVRGLAFGASGALYTASDDGTVRAWDVARGTDRIVGRHRGRAYRIALAPDETRLAAAGSDGDARIWDVANGSSVELPGHHPEANDVAFSPDGRWLATGGDEGTVRLWAAATGRPVWRTVALLGSPVVAYTHEGWRRPDTNAQSVAPGGPWAAALAGEGARATQSADGAVVCLKILDGKVQLWDTAGDRAIVETPAPAARALTAYANGCMFIDERGAVQVTRAGASVVAPSASAIATDGGGVLIASGRDVLAMDANGAVRQRLPGAEDVTAIARTSQLLILGTGSGHIEFVPLASDVRRPAFSLENASPTAVTALGAGPRGTVVVAYAGGLVGVWSLDNGERLEHAQLYGAATDILVRGERLYAASELGDLVSIDLSPLEMPYCELLRAVWADAPVIWERGLPRRMPPPAHVCRD